MIKTFKLVFVCITVSASILHVQAQQCGIFLPMVQGTTYEYKVLRGDGLKPFGKYEYKITSFDGTKGTFEVQQFRESGSKIEKPAKYTVSCNADNVKIKPDSTNWPAMTMGTMTFANTPQEGQTLPSVTTNFYTVKNSSKVFGIVEVYNFTVKKKETITVAAGTFEAFLIEYDIFARPGAAPPKTHIKEWYAPSKGLIKSERYGPNGTTLYVTLELVGAKK